MFMVNFSLKNRVIGIGGLHAVSFTCCAFVSDFSFVYVIKF
jgi:hypothetical protein